MNQSFLFELAQSFISGERKYVCEELFKMSQAEAMHASAWLIDYFKDDNYTSGVFLRMLADKIGN